jgi:mRNA interferase RelE/StbE
MFEIEFSRKGEKFYSSADDKTARILNRCFETIAKEPFYHANIKKLHGEFEGSYRYRSGSLRIIYSVDEEEKIIYIEVITDRGRSYR